VSSPSHRSLSEEELKANALKAANGRSFSRRGIRVTWLWEWAKVFPAAILLFLGLRTFLVEAYKIPSGSMEQTLLVGDFLLVNKLVYGAQVPFTHMRTPVIRSPKVGDIVIFAYPVDPRKNYVKRLVGVAGDTLAMANGVLVRNGQTQNEAYVIHSEPGYDPVAEDFRWQRGYLVRTAEAASSLPAADGQDSASTDATFVLPEVYRPSRNNWGPIVVPPGHLFMLGDNRDDSEDSRYWGFVADSLVRGTPMMVYYSFSPDSTSVAPWLTRVRWGRFGTRVR
jgi:signal peptidase I